jgi:RNA polymerase sigma-70 factor (ECF subfamily)
MEMDISDVSTKTDEELVTLTLQDKEYFAYIIERYDKKMARYIRRLLSVSKDDINDVLQNVFLKTYVNLNNFDTKLKFSSWLYRIAHNESITYFRKHKVCSRDRVEIEYEHLANIASEYDLKKEIEDKEFKEDLEKQIAELDQKYREVLVLKFLEDKDYREISDILKKPMGTVATLMNRAKGKLKKSLSEDDD